MSLKDLTQEELSSRIESASLKYRCALGGRFFHTEDSLGALEALEPLVLEQERRYREERDARAKIERENRERRELAEILSRRPANPTPEDIPRFSPDDYQKVVKEIRGWALIKADCTTPLWSVYEFDTYLWTWMSRSNRPRRKDAMVYFDGCESPTQEDIDKDSSKVRELQMTVP